MVEHRRLKLDLQLFAGEKTEKATPKKKLDARKKGQVAKSNEIPSAFIMLFVFLAFMMFSGFFQGRMNNFFTVAYTDYMQLEITTSNVSILFSQLAFQGTIILLPIMIIAVVTAFLGNYIQFGFLVSGEPLKMKLNKLNPIEGAKKIFAIRALVEFAKSVLKLIVIGVVVSFTLWLERSTLLSLSSMPLESTFAYAARITLLIGLQIALLLVVLSIFDYMYQKYEHEKSLRMSKQDIKDEFKKMEGDPLIKSKIREKQRRMAMQRMMQEVPNADVVITNPTHYAVALKYDREKMEAPFVVAKGQDYVALKIKEAAQRSGVITMENKPLARALYAQVEIGEPIPDDLFQAVAEVLAYVYKVKGNA
ncbi:flagellar biosynthetic protein FlhB [Xylanibacillus composti]|uniref:Flagellar biosynthetic protein FlhB n=1 Tax=Xylanibacillus composti TaxID=1572762 RepID=A0A8J4H4Z4_9BACL|nr:flagellar biosynthesis protein FlhB [Xylanibacillus composti]GIQ68628.1 flagellar biosynthetic protein FlhB [Xylanibacillus composti]